MLGARYPACGFVLLAMACGAPPGPSAPEATARRTEREGHRVRPESELEAGQLVREDAAGTGFSARAASPRLSLLTLDYAIGTSIRAHPSGDVIIAGCTEGPTALRPQTEEGRVLAFVARVDPRAGVVRWARHFDAGSESFENTCLTRHRETHPGPTLYATTLVAVDRDGDVLVSVFVPRVASPVEPSVEPGAAILRLADDGSIAGVHRIGAPSELVAVTQLVASDDAADAIVRRFAADGLDAHTVLHVDGAGRASERASLRFTPMPARSAPCHPGPSGCRVEVAWASRAEDGSLLLHGNFAGTELTIGASSVRSTPDGARSHGFWACLEADGALRWLRAGPEILTTIVLAHDHEVVAVQHTREHEEIVRQLATRTGAASRPRAPRPSSPLSRALRMYEARRRLLGGATADHPNGVLPLAPAPIGRAMTADQLRILGRIDPSGPSPITAELTDGGLVEMMTIPHAIRIDGRRIEPGYRMVECDPGPVGEELTLPPECRQRLERRSIVLLVGPATAP